MTQEISVGKPRRQSWKTWPWLTAAMAAVAVFCGIRYYMSAPVVQAQGTAGSQPGRAASSSRPHSAVPAGQSAPAAARTTAAGPAAPKPNVVAIVNGTAITREELGQECIRRYGEEVLEGLVNRYLIALECQRRHIQISEQDVWAEIDRMAKKFGLSTERWLKLLQEERNISPEQYQRDVIWPMLALRRLSANEIQVTQEDLRRAFETEYGPKVKVRVIVSEDRATAEQLLARVKADPESFGDVAKDHSSDQTSAAARGLIPPIRKHTAPPELEQAAFALEEGQISDVIPVANQFFILKCERKIPETLVNATQLEEIRQRLAEQIRDQKLREAAAALFKRLQDEARVVNVFNEPRMREQMPGVAALINGHAITLAELAEECIVRHGEEVLDGEINRRILEQALAGRKLSISQADLDEEIRRAADAYGFVKMDGTPDVDAWLKHITSEGGEHITVDVYVRDAVWPSVALKKLVGQKVEVTDEDLRKGFEANYGERVEVLAIVLSNQRRAQQVWEMARNNPSEEFFGELAAQYSIEPVSRANFGRVPPIRRHSGSEAVEEEAFRLKPGELSGIVAVADKFIIMKCLGRTQPVVQDISEVRDELFREIHEQKLRAAMNQEFDRLRQAAKIQVFLTGVVKRGVLPAATPSADVN
ncbi:MAG: peptidylprolyl isomerase [Pirellulaceae bacterium]|nr:MAG: peptidylprolyl isomerase [Pirellulaceae bacterium]